MDELTLVALLDSLSNESKKMKDDEAKHREEGNKVVADYISHKRMGFVLAMAFVVEATKIQPIGELKEAMAIL